MRSCTCMHALLWFVSRGLSGDIDMSLDGQKGCQLVRVILQFIMSEDSTLSCRSVKLLSRQFSQRKELLDGFKKVCLRVRARARVCVCV